jgi:hypothetical protein
MGTIVSLMISGLFCTFSFNDSVPFLFRYGWAYFFYLLGKHQEYHYIFHSVIYILGGLGILWSIVWLVFSSDIPATNKFISANEKKYIRACKIDEKLQDTNTVNTKYLILFCDLSVLLENTLGTNASIKRILVYIDSHGFL